METAPLTASTTQIAIFDDEYVTAPDPADGVAGEIVNPTSPYDLTTGEIDPNAIVRETDPGAFVLGGPSTIGGAGGTTVEVEDSFVAIVVAVGAAPRVGSASPGFLPVFDFFPLPEPMVVEGSPSNVVVVATYPLLATVVSTLAEGELLRLANNATGAESARTDAAPIANA
jgi:hypothetical protein